MEPVITYESPGNLDRIPEFDPRSGDHYWVFIATWYFNPDKMDVDKLHLDKENLVSLTGPGCFYCEEKYTSLLAKRRCKGSPSYL